MRRLMLIFVMPLLACGWCAGCGGSAHEATGEAEAHPSKPAKRMEISGQGKKGSGPVGDRSACTEAKAIRGRAPGQVYFTAQCLGRAKGGVIDLVIVRHPIGDPSRRARIVRYRHALEVTGPGAGAHRGACSLRQHALECSIKAHGPVDVEGTFWAPPATACRSNVSIVSIIVAACEGQICEGSPVLRELFYGRPSECSKS